MIKLSWRSGACLVVGCIVIGLVLASCYAGATPGAIANKVTPTVTAVVSRPATFRIAPTVTIVLTPPPQPAITAVASASRKVDKALLISVSENGSDRPREEIWILEAGQVVPRPLLQDPQYSFEKAAWAHNGEWIAFARRALTGAGVYCIGIIRKDGTDQRLITNDEFSFVYFLGWSSSDRWIVFDAITPEGDKPYSLDVETGTLTDLDPDSSVQYSELVSSPSPTDDLIAFVGLWGDDDNPQARMTILSLRDSNRILRVANDPWLDCAKLTGLTWSPDGESLAVQPTVTRSQNVCHPQIWMYDVTRQQWSKIAQLTDVKHRYRWLGWRDWSPDRRWLAWSQPDSVLIYDATTWQIIREVKMQGTQMLMATPWVVDSVGNSILTVSENASPAFTSSATILGMNPDRNDRDAMIVAQILDVSDWLPRDTYYEPVSWQP